MPSIKARVAGALHRLRYRKGADYRAREYWHDRLQRAQHSKRGVGNCSLSERENEQAYTEARRTFLEVIGRLGVDWGGTSVLDIGCGTGFYAATVEAEGCRRYLGVDITDALHADLRQRHPGFEFRRLDVTETAPPGKFDIVIMIDVTQHIVDEEKFVRAMGHVRDALEVGGLFVVTSWLQPYNRRQLHEVARPMESYREAFPGFTFGEPVPFRDKYLFTIRRPD